MFDLRLCFGGGWVVWWMDGWNCVGLIVCLMFCWEMGLVRGRGDGRESVWLMVFLGCFVGVG